MLNFVTLHTKKFLRFGLFMAGISLLIAFSGCGSSTPTKPAQGPQRYPLTGRVVSVEKDKEQVVVDGADIPGFMMAMTMGYSVKNPNLLETISPEDQIKADVVVNDKDVWLENIVVVKKADQSKAPSASGSQTAPAAPSKP
jgi:Cu/Ag efflux protein CusF